MASCLSCGHENGAGARYCEACGEALVSMAAAGAQRKTVTVLFCDVTGSTALGEQLDPERLRDLLALYFVRMKGIIEAYGGSVEKFIGDAVMAVFGVPLVHEDDALRACRAAVEMREAFPDLGVEGRIGLMTGEVVTGTEERLATGDALNVAARLQQAARPGEVLIGGTVLALVCASAEVEAVEPLVLKGKAEPVPAFRLLTVRDAAERRRHALFVGRERELGLIQAAWECAQAEKRCELVTIVGEAGVGKSHLVAEALTAIDGRVVQGRCLPYGDGISYWPVVEVVKQLDALPADPAAATAIRSLLGKNAAGSSAEETAWAFRKLLEQEAPLVVVFDDLQWGEQSFLDLVEHLALLSSGSPLLLLCMARPELGERRSGWPVTVQLEPLGDDDIDLLIGSRVPAELAGRIARTAGGNPLFVTEMLAITEQAEHEVRVPPTLRALLAARLDQLEPGERQVLEHGAIEGEIFHRGAVQALAYDSRPVTPRLAALVRKQLIRPHRAQLSGEDGFRFRHLLVRDSAYGSLPKATRADLHERFAGWLGQRATDLVELDELLGYHLEQAFRYRAELGPVDDLTRAIGANAGERLAAAGRRAADRRDERAALNLLGRALALHQPEDPAVSLRLDLSHMQASSGQLAVAAETVRAAAVRATAAGDRPAAMRARLWAAEIESFLDPEGGVDRLLVLIAEARPLFENAGDELGMSELWLHVAHVEAGRGRAGAALEAIDRAATHARMAGDLRQEERALDVAVGCHRDGPTPVADALAWLDTRGALGELRTPFLAGSRAALVAMLGDFDGARAVLAGVVERLAELGSNTGPLTESAYWVETLAGDYAAAEREARRGYELLEQSGNAGIRSTLACLLAQSLSRLGRTDEAEVMLAVADELSASDDIINMILVPQIRAKLLAQRGDFDAAQLLARQAVAIAEQSDWFNFHGDALVDLAEVYALAGRPHLAADAAGQALALYERKGNLVSAENARSELNKLLDTTAPGQ